jgi:hypothetical protein
VVISGEALACEPAQWLFSEGAVTWYSAMLLGCWDDGWAPPPDASSRQSGLVHNESIGEVIALLLLLGHA